MGKDGKGCGTNQHHRAGQGQSTLCLRHKKQGNIGLQFVRLPKSLIRNRMHDPDAHKLRRYFALLAEDLTPAQAARAAERWELICEQEGWLYLSETHPYAPPAVSKQPEPPPQ